MMVKSKQFFTTSSSGIGTQNFQIFRADVTIGEAQQEDCYKYIYMGTIESQHCCCSTEKQI